MLFTQKSKNAVITYWVIYNRRKGISTLPRFWKDVHIQKNNNDGKFQVLLDKRVLKSPEGKQLDFDAEETAILVANEWDSQESALKPHSLPLTSIIMRSIDSLSGGENDRKAVMDLLERYLHTDTILFPQNFPGSIVELQNYYWSPIYKLIKDNLAVDLSINEGLLVRRQSDQVLSSIREEMENMSHIELAALEKSVQISKSFCIGLCLVKNWISVDFATKAATVEVTHQLKRWGELEDAHVLDRSDISRQLGAVAAVLMSIKK